MNLPCRPCHIQLQIRLVGLLVRWAARYLEKEPHSESPLAWRGRERSRLEPATPCTAGQLAVQPREQLHRPSLRAQRCRAPTRLRLAVDPPPQQPAARLLVMAEGGRAVRPLRSRLPQSWHLPSRQHPPQAQALERLPAAHRRVPVDGHVKVVLVPRTALRRRALARAAAVCATCTVARAPIGDQKPDLPQELARLLRTARRVVAWRRPAGPPRATGTSRRVRRATGRRSE